MQKGEPSPNPGGRPRAFRESLDWWRCHADEIDGYLLELARRGAENGGLTKAEELWSKHLLAVREIAFGRPAQSVMIGGSLDVGEGDGSAVSALLARARLSTPRSITPIEKPIGRDDVIVVDTNGAAGLAAEPPKATASAAAETAAPAQSTAAAEDPPPPKAAPFQAEPPPEEAPRVLKREPPYQGRDVTPKPKPKYSGMPAAFAEHKMRKEGEFLSAAQTSERDRLMAEKVTAARALGICQLHPSEVLPADEAGRPNEVVNFTRVPGGKGIRRC